MKTVQDNYLIEFKTVVSHIEDKSLCSHDFHIIQNKSSTFLKRYNLGNENNLFKNKAFSMNDFPDYSIPCHSKKWGKFESKKIAKGMIFAKPDNFIF